MGSSRERHLRDLQVSPAYALKQSAMLFPGFASTPYRSLHRKVQHGP